MANPEPAVCQMDGVHIAPHAASQIMIGAEQPVCAEPIAPIADHNCYVREVYEAQAGDHHTHDAPRPRCSCFISQENDHGNCGRHNQCIVVPPRDR